MTHTVDITNQRFGRLLAIERTSEKQRTNWLWRCICDCGNERFLTVSTLRSGNTQSCGCLRIERLQAAFVKKRGGIARNRQDIIGNRYGNLVVTEFFETRQTPGGTYRTYWHCICDCEKYTVVSGRNLKSGEIQTCGCGASKPSREECSIADFLSETGIEIETNRKIGKSQFRYDIISHKHKIVIEFNGVFWHSAAKVDKGYHYRKRIAAEAAGYRMISIWQDDWRTKPDRIKEHLMRAFDKAKLVRIGARNLIVKVISATEANAFHTANHIQSGRVAATTHIALIAENIIVAVASFRQSKKETCIVRYTIASGWSISGGLEKLVSAYGGSNPIVTYCDRDFFEGDIYYRSGFVKFGCTLQLSYLHGSTRYRREKFMRHKLGALGIAIAKGETERAALEKVGIFQCWNSGIDKWILHRRAH
jgi:very-short-patch-repair endonuclease